MPVADGGIVHRQAGRGLVQSPGSIDVPKKDVTNIIRQVIYQFFTIRQSHIIIPSSSRPQRRVADGGIVHRQPGRGLAISGPRRHRGRAQTPASLTPKLGRDRYDKTVTY